MWEIRINKKRIRKDLDIGDYCIIKNGWAIPIQHSVTTRTFLQAIGTRVYRYAGEDRLFFTGVVQGYKHDL